MPYTKVKRGLAYGRLRDKLKKEGYKHRWNYADRKGDYLIIHYWKPSIKRKKSRVTYGLFGNYKFRL